jgi:hypothetical protein
VFVCTGLSVVVTTQAAPVSVLTYHNDNFRTGQNTNETILHPGNVNSTTFAKLFTYAVDGYVYAQPLCVSGLVIPGQGIHNVLYVATEHNSVYALEADSNKWFTNGVIWKASFGFAAITPTNSFGIRYGNYSDITPEVGITSTPVIDVARGTIYVDAFTREAAGFVHRIHALNLTNGAEQANSPVIVAATYPGTGAGSAGGVLTFSAQQHIQRSALTLAGGTLYLSYSGYADTNPYHGWVLGYDPVTLQLKPGYIWVTTPNSSTTAYGANAGEAGIWMGGCGMGVDENTNLYFLTGNGVFTASNSVGTEFGDSIIRLSTTNGLKVADYFTPWDEHTWSVTSGDTDLGSGGLILVPNMPGTNAHLLIGGGKAGKFYVVNRDQLTTNNAHYTPSGNYDAVLQTLTNASGFFMCGPAYFNTNVYYCNYNGVMKMYGITNGILTKAPTSTGSRTFGKWGCAPAISANGTSNGIVWVTDNRSPAILAAFNATNVTTEIYNSTNAAGGRDTMPNGVKFANPTVANGKVYAGAQYAVAVYGLLDPSLNWKTFHFGNNASNAAISGDLVDPDGDGVLNLLEYALGSDPNTANPGATLSAVVTGGHFKVSFNRNASATDLTYEMESSTDLMTWIPATTYTSAAGWVSSGVASTTEGPPSALPPDQTVKATIDMGVPSASALFLRLKVHR